MFARSEIQTGDWNPHHDYRYITYWYSLISITSWLIFNIFGIGIFQTNAVASILSILSILIFYFIVRRATGNGAAILTLLFIGLNFLGIFYGRRPFLENGMNLMFIIGLFFLIFMEKKILGHFLFGLFFAGSVFFGKIIALGFVGVPVLYYAYRIFYLRDKSAFAQAAVMSLGFVALFALWLMVIFTPYQEHVTGYVGEQALGLYGIPDGFKSVGLFIWKLLTLCKKSAFVDSMPILVLSSLFLFILIISRVFTQKENGRVVRYENTAFIIIILWLVSTYLALTPWNYRPARYQTAMIYPVAAMAGVFIAYLCNLRDTAELLTRNVVNYLTIFGSVLWVIYFYTGALVVSLGYDYYFYDYFLYVLIVSVVIVAFYVVITRKVKSYKIKWTPYRKYITIAILLVAFLFMQGKAFFSWTGNILYTTRDSSRDLGVILSPGAVISGPFGPALAQENNLGCLIHIFGTSRPDPDLFKKYPVTHLVLERANEKAAREMYPNLMDQVKAVTHYYINCRKITVFRIAFASDNPETMEYFPSNYELAVAFYRHNLPDSGDFYLSRFLKLSPENVSGNVLAGYYAQQRGQYDRAIEYYSKAVEFSPTEFNLHYLLGQAYKMKADSTGEGQWYDLAMEESVLATGLDLGYHDFDEYMKESYKDDKVGKSDDKR
jgi:hypothetical protein